MSTWRLVVFVDAPAQVGEEELRAAFEGSEVFADGRPLFAGIPEGELVGKLTIVGEAERVVE